jgi:hypothetical protein
MTNQRQGASDALLCKYHLCPAFVQQVYILFIPTKGAKEDSILLDQQFSQ